ncbi:hypothetical protein [Serratia sp. (in: enterobacteria)]|uniref:hypothetical protein n=1 Tax=Serratia sp. (in: enterobacteria) TaxID=616 RepID=UPI00398992A5
MASVVKKYLRVTAHFAEQGIACNGNPFVYYWTQQSIELAPPTGFPFKRLINHLNIVDLHASHGVGLERCPMQELPSVG